MLKKAFILSFVFVTISCAAGYNGVIYTWGYASIINDIFQAVKGAVTGVDSLIKSAMAVAFFIFAIKKAMDSRVNPVMEFSKMIFLFATVSYFFAQAQDDDNHRFIIEDKVSGEMFSVSQIPIGIGKSFSMFSMLESGIVDVMELHFSTPSSINYSQVGFGYSLTTHMTVSQMQILDTYYTRTFNEFVGECVLYDITTGATNVSSIIDNDDLSSSIFNTVSSRLTSKYTSSNPSGEVLQCSEVGAYLANNLSSQMDSTEKLASALNGQTLANFQDHAGGVRELFFNSANSSRDYVQQMALINMTSGAVINSAKASGLDPSALAWASAVADQQFTMQMQTQSMMAQKYLPRAKAYFTAMIIAISWLIAILSIMFGDYRHITMFFTLMLWMVFWTPILLVINYFNDINLRDTFLALKGASGADLTISHNRIVMNELVANSNFVKWLVMMTPVLAYSLVKASEHGFVSLASSLSSSLSGAGTAAAREITNQSTTQKPSIRVGSEVYTDMGSQYSAQGQSMTNGHGWNDSSFTDRKTGQSTYSGTMTDGSGSLGMSGGQVYSANSPIALSAAHKNSVSSSSELSSSISNTSSNVIGNKEAFGDAQSKGVSTQDVSNVQEAMGKAMSKQFEHMSGYGEDFNNLKRIAMQGGGNISADLSKVGVSGGVTYSGVDQDGKKYSWTDSSKDAEQNFHNLQEQFSHTVSGNSSYLSSYSKLLEKTDTKAYAEMQSAITKFNTSELAERGLNANNLPSLINNWIKGDESLSRMPPEIAAKHVLGEISNLASNGQWEKIGDLTNKYGGGGFGLDNNPTLKAPTKLGNVDVKGQYDSSLQGMDDMLKKETEKSQAMYNQKAAGFGGDTKGKVEGSIEKGKTWAEQGLFGRFWDDNSTGLLVGAAGIATSLGLTSSAAKKFGGELFDKFKGAGNIEEMEDLMKKTNQLDEAIKKNSPEAKKLMSDLGLKDTFERNGGVFSKSGAIDEAKTKLNHELADYARSTARNGVGDAIKSNSFTSERGWYEASKDFIGGVTDDVWKSAKSITPSKAIHGAAALGTVFMEGVPLNPTSFGNSDLKMLPVPPQGSGEQFNLINPNDQIDRKIGDLQIELKQMQKNMPSETIPDTKKGKGDVL